MRSQKKSLLNINTKQYEEKLIALRANAATEDRNPKPHRELITALLEGLSAPGKPNLDRFEELIRELELVSKLDPKDHSTAIMLADVYFNNKSFKKSIEHYQRYLKLKPEDHQARGRYASALTFMSRFEEAVSELKSIIKKDPHNFHAYAYLSITYSQMKKIKEAHKAGKKALELAPSDEARKRFGSYLVSIGGAAPKDAKQAEPEEEMPQVVAARVIINHVRANPVAGPKYDRFEFPENSYLLLYFKNFPMEKMPDFARKKFISGIKERIQDPIKEVAILDADSGKEMAKVSLD